MADWDPEFYNRFRRYRAEPVEAILRRLQLDPQERIVDLGCGSGENIVELLRRAPRGSALGIDSSPAMIERAENLRATLEPALQARLRFVLGDITRFQAEREFSLVFSNAALHWVPNHRAVFAACHRALTPGGKLVVQIPANDEETAQQTLMRMVAEEPWRAKLGAITVPSRIVGSPEQYQRMLAELKFVEVDCYYHTFRHPMSGGPADVVAWSRPTTLRPFLDALPESRHDEFVAEWQRRLELAYGSSGPMIFTFRRLFIWARRPID